VIPGDEDILNLLRRGGWSPTYYVRDYLREKGFRAVKASQLRLRLEKLAVEGVVTSNGGTGRETKWKLIAEERV